MGRVGFQLVRLTERGIRIPSRSPLRGLNDSLWDQIGNHFHSLRRLPASGRIPLQLRRKLRPDMKEPKELKEVLNLALESQDEERYKLVGELNRRKIKNLFHFTHVDNLESIFKFGFKPKAVLASELINFIETDKERFDGITQSISFSLEYPNEWLLRHKIRQFGFNFVVLELPASLLLSHPFLAFPGNAAGGAFLEHRLENPSEYIGLRGVQNMFLSPHVRNLNNLESNQPTDIQAEILILKDIASSNITRVHIPANIAKTVSSPMLFPTPAYHLDCNCAFFSPYQYKPYDQRRFHPGWRITT